MIVRVRSSWYEWQDIDPNGRKFLIDKTKKFVVGIHEFRQARFFLNVFHVISTNNQENTLNTWGANFTLFYGGLHHFENIVNVSPTFGENFEGLAPFWQQIIIQGLREGTPIDKGVDTVWVPTWAVHVGCVAAINLLSGGGVFLD